MITKLLRQAGGRGGKGQGKRAGTKPRLRLFWGTVYKDKELPCKWESNKELEILRYFFRSKERMLPGVCVHRCMFGPFLLILFLNL